METEDIMNVTRKQIEEATKDFIGKPINHENNKELFKEAVNNGISKFLNEWGLNEIPKYDLHYEGDTLVCRPYVETVTVEINIGEDK